MNILRDISDATIVNYNERHFFSETKNKDNINSALFWFLM